MYPIPVSDSAIVLRAAGRLQVASPPALDPYANAIAWSCEVTIYGALYVALAEKLGYPLITADDVMLRKLKGHSIVLPLRELKFRQ